MEANNEMTGLKRVEVGLLKEFIAVCERLDLPYYVIAGTLIGTVRHQGFIPWDDDIDVCMMRSDYERFCAGAQALLPDWCFLQTQKTDPEFPANFAKLRDSRTTFIENSVRYRNMNHGIFLDIFPLDYYPQPGFRRKWIRFRNTLCMTRIDDSFSYPRKAPTLKCRLAKTAARILYPGDTVYARRERMFRKTPPGDLVISYCGAWGERECWRTEWFGTSKKMTFEGLSVCVPSDYDKVLTKTYGDYMTLPPEEKRVSHHGTVAEDSEKPYTEYTGGSR